MADLREIIRAEVERVLAEFLAKGGGSKRSRRESRLLVVLFSGTRWPADAVFGQLEALVERGYRLVCVLSESFRSCQEQRFAALRLPRGIDVLAQQADAQILDLAKQGDAVVAACFSANSAAKLSAGIFDSVPTVLVRAFLELAKPVIVAEDSAVLRESAAPPSAPPKLRRLAEDAYHGLAEMGVRFVAPTDLERAVDQAFFVPVNETPERLAKTRPTKQRMFVTSEDVWKALSQGHKQLIVTEDAVVTDEARDHARRVGLEILRQ
ncbi:MAG: hypothetical protein ACP5QZ_01940 [Candidatus Sumerlaeaceae bacterium]